MCAPNTKTPSYYAVLQTWSKITKIWCLWLCAEQKIKCAWFTDLGVALEKIFYINSIKQRSWQVIVQIQDTCNRNGNPLTNNIENFSICSIFCRYDFADSKFSLTTSIKLSKSLAFSYAFISRKFSPTLIATQCFTNVLKAFSSLSTTVCIYCFAWFFLCFFGMPWVTAGDTWHASSLCLR